MKFVIEKFGRQLFLSRNISFVFNSLLFNLVATRVKNTIGGRFARVFCLEMGSQPNYSWLASFVLTRAAYYTSHFRLSLSV